MRVVFLLLLLVNLLIAGWSYWFSGAVDERVAAPVTGSDEGISGLRLLTELPNEELVSPAAVTEPAPLADAPVTPAVDANSEAEKEPGPHTESILAANCYRIAHLGRKNERDALAQKISALGITVLERGEEFNERQTFWVYIPPLKSNEAAQQVLQALSKARVRDYLLVRSGEYKNAISLGLFSQREGAEKRLAEITALQLKAGRPLLNPRTSTYRSFWLLINDVENQGETPLLQLLQKEQRVASGVECPS